MYKIKIDEIENSSNKTLNIDYDGLLPEIESKGNICAKLDISSLGEFIKVTGSISGVAILQCDLCLEKFDYQINIEINELFAKKTIIDECNQEIELKEGQFVTDLKGASELDIEDILYQSVILDFPNKKVCGINCKGGDIFIRDENSSEDSIDPRMAIFKNIDLNKRK